jgi:hypothetical protein
LEEKRQQILQLRAEMHVVENQILLQITPIVAIAVLKTAQKV